MVLEVEINIFLRKFLKCLFFKRIVLRDKFSHSVRTEMNVNIDFCVMKRNNVICSNAA